MHEHRHDQPVSFDVAPAVGHGPLARLGQTPGSSHGHGAPEHFGQTLTPTPVFLIPPPSTAVRDLPPPPLVVIALSPVPRAVKVARGPPAGRRPTSPIHG
jgi:hypothetical protein